MNKIIYILLVTLLPSVALAQMTISEVMYDLPGVDSGREWIEVYNNTGEVVDLSKYSLREGNTNHKLVLAKGNTLLSPMSLAIIADDANQFVADNPNFSGTIFNSVFSLSNSGETISLVSGSSTIDSFSYTSSLGALGDGNSLQKTESGIVAAPKTPGVYLATYNLPPPAVKTPVQKISETKVEPVAQTEKSKPEIVVDPIPSSETTSQISNENPVEENHFFDPSLWKWLGLLSLILIPSVGVLYLRQKQKPLAPHGFEIIE